MASLDDDEDLKRALAMSLEEAQSSPPAAIDLAESDDEDMRRAIALSLGGDGASDEASVPSSSANTLPSSSQNSLYASKLPQSSIASQEQVATSSQSSTSSRPGGLLGFDRKAMEQERLARLGKRKHSASPERPSKVATRTPNVTTTLDSSNTAGVSIPSGLQYPRGAIKRTWAYKYPRTNDIKIEEVFQASTLNIAVLSAFLPDDRWIYSKIDPNKIKQIWIMSAKGQEVQDEYKRQALAANVPNLKPHFPPMDGQIMNMHSKLMLLFHDTHLRVVVPTANLIKFDWGETNRDPNGESWQPAVMENTAFLVDLPRRSDGQVGCKQDLTAFGKGLLEFLEAQQLGNNVLEGLLKFDFSDTGRIGFVHSIPGALTEPRPNRTGLPGLAKAVRTLGLEGHSLVLDYAASSLGAVKESFLKQLYAAASGRHSPDPKVPKDFLDKVSIYFPSSDTVETSNGGPDCGGIITLGGKDYNEYFPKQCMREYKSTRTGVLSHNKILLVRGQKKNGKPLAWAYVGSANLSESAWGSQKILKSGKEGKLNIRNWECGVVVPVPDEDLVDVDMQDGKLPPLDVFKNTLEIPWQRPGEQYGDKEPWFFRDRGT